MPARGSLDVVVEKVDERIHLYSPPPWEMPGVLEMIKSVNGRNWNKTLRVWTYPLNMDVCRGLRSVFSDMLVIGPELTAWASERVAREKSMAQLGKARDAELRLVPEVAPALAEAMADRTYQRSASKFVSTAGSVLLADQPGLGKTLEYIGGVIESGHWIGRHIVAAPKTSLRLVWEYELLRWTNADIWVADGSDERRRMVIEDFLNAPPGPNFLVVNPEMLRIKQWEEYDPETGKRKKLQEAKYPVLHEQVWDTVAIDEAHKYLLGIRNKTNVNQVGRGLLAIRGKVINCALTGTPMKGVVRNMWGILHWLYPADYSSFWQWAGTFLEVTEEAFGKTVGDLRKDREEDFYRSLDTVMIRRTKAEVATELPPKLYNNVWCELTGEQKKQYKEMYVEAETMFGDYSIAPTGVLAELTRLRQISICAWEITAPGAKPTPTAASGKITRLLEMLEERGVTGDPKTEFGEDKYVIASQFTQVIDFLFERLTGTGIGVVRVTGRVKDKDRVAAVQAFQGDGGPRIMLINTMAGGVAITLDRHCDELFFLDETFVPDDQEQVEDRIHRVSRTHQVTIHYLRTLNTIEEGLKEMSDRKENVQKIILDGRRGVDFVRRLIKETHK